MSGEVGPAVIRLYRESTETEYCADAVRLLLNFKESKQKGAQPGAPDDAEGLKNARTDTEIIPR